MFQKPLVGILGGMGTSAGLYFQNLFFNICNQNGITGDQNYPEWIYINASLANDRTIAIKDKGPSPIPYLVKILRKMDSAGVTAVVVICNTAHAFYEKIISEVSLPWIHLPYETSLVLKNSGINKIGILTTDGVLLSAVYKRIFERIGIQVIEPAPHSSLQKKIMNCIYDKNYGIKYSGSQPTARTQHILMEAVEELNVNTILIGCTELSVAFSNMKLHIQSFDPTTIAAQTLFDFWQGNRSVQSLQPSIDL